MAESSARLKPTKLKSPVTRDTFYTWTLNHKAFCRQNPDWLQFLPGSLGFSSWVPYNEDEIRGILIPRTDGQGREQRDGQGVIIPDMQATNKARAALESFLVCLGTYCPDMFMHTVVQESSSFNWVMDKIKKTFKLETKGLGVLAGADIKVDYSAEGQTHAQGLQAFREFYSDSLLDKGDLYKGKAMGKKEPLSPLAENLIVKEWLDSIDKRLRGHIMRTRGHLITADRPNLSDIQHILCEQMDTLLAELDAMGGPGIGRAGFPVQEGFNGMPTYTMQGGAPPVVGRTGWPGQVGARRNPAAQFSRPRGQGNYGGGVRGGRGYFGGGAQVLPAMLHYHNHTSVKT